MTFLISTNKNTTDFSTLLTDNNAHALLKTLNALVLNDSHKLDSDSSGLNSSDSEDLKVLNFNNLTWLADDYKATEALIQLFNTLFSDQQVQLVRGEHDPEYFPADNGKPARLEFAHGFFASALHEAHTPLYRLTC